MLYGRPRIALVMRFAIVRNAIDIPSKDRDGRLTSMVRAKKDFAGQVRFEELDRISRLAPPRRSVERGSTIASPQQRDERRRVRLARVRAAHPSPPRLDGSRISGVVGSNAWVGGSGSGSGGGRATEPARRRALAGARRPRRPEFRFEAFRPVVEDFTTNALHRRASISRRRSLSRSRAYAFAS
jgi:hypothetical protein